MTYRKWSGQQWYMSAPRPSGSSVLTLLTMTEEEMKAVEQQPRRPLGFAPPAQVSGKPHIRAKVR